MKIKVRTDKWLHKSHLRDQMHRYGTTKVPFDTLYSITGAFLKEPFGKGHRIKFIRHEHYPPKTINLREELLIGQTYIDIDKPE